MMNSGIYKITCTPSKKIYIGSTKSFISRWKNHILKLKNNCHVNNYLQRAWNKYGENEFIFTILEEIVQDKLLKREQWWLDNTKCYQPDIGFNIAKIAGMPSHKGIGEEEAIRRLYEIINKYKVLNKLPKKDNCKQENKSDAYWIYRTRESKSAKNVSIWYPILDEIAKQNNFGGIFDNHETIAIQRLNEIISTYKNINNLPSARSKNIKEKSDAIWLTKKRASKANANNRPWYPILEEIAIKNNFIDLFSI